MKLPDETILNYRPALKARFDASLYEGENPNELRIEKQRLTYMKSKTLLGLKVCPFCHEPLHYKYRDDGMAMNQGWGVYVNSCLRCGWWCCTEERTPVGSVEIDEEMYKNDASLWDFTFVEGVIQQFNANTLKIPLSVLKDYVLKNPNVLYNIHHRKFEELIADIFSDFFDCEVILTGQTVDGGVDLYMINGDNTYLVQAKRRTKKSKTEGVTTIRELAGVLLISGHTKGIVVSTAEKYSKSAIKESRSDSLIKQGYTLELINYSKFLDIFNATLVRKNHEPLWEEFFRRPIEVSKSKDIVKGINDVCI